MVGYDLNPLDDSCYLLQNENATVSRWPPSKHAKYKVLLLFNSTPKEITVQYSVIILKKLSAVHFLSRSRVTAFIIAQEEDLMLR